MPAKVMSKYKKDVTSYTLNAFACVNYLPWTPRWPLTTDPTKNISVSQLQAAFNNEIASQTDQTLPPGDADYQVILSRKQPASEFTAANRSKDIGVFAQNET